MNFDPKAVRRALMVAKDLAASIDPGFANINVPMPPEGVPLERAAGGPADAPQIGINVRSDTKAGIRYADEIVDGNKAYETRDTDSLRPYVGKRVAIVRTGEGPAKAIGEVTVGKPIVADQDMFHRLRNQHLVPAGSAFDIKPGSTKHLYPMHDPVRYDNERGVGAGIVARKVMERAKGGPIKTVQGPERDQNLKDWLGDSFLHVDGVPRTYYHGTSKDTPFSSFKVGRHGAWFASDPKEASMYASQNDSMSSRYEGGRFVPTNTASRVMPVYLKASNPYMGEFPEKYKNVDNYKKANSDWFDELRAAGYDSWVPRSQQGNLAVMLEGPHQVKSAVGNDGTFDHPTDIAKAEGGAVDDDEIQPRNLNPMGLYSAAAEAARAIPQERGTPQQMLATMKGVKPDELNWSGAQNKFANQKTITRDDLAQHFENSLPPITEQTSDAFRDYTVPGGDNYRATLLTLPPDLSKQAYGTDFNQYRKESHWSEPNVIAHLRLKDREYSERKRTPKPDTTTNISVNTPLTPSGVGTRAIDAWSSPTPGLVVTKSLEPDERGLFRVTHVGTGLNASANKAFSFPQAMDAARRLGELWDGWEKDADAVKAWAKENGKAARDTLNQASNPLGKKALHLEELQSDWAQEGREKGFVGPKDVQKAQQDLENLNKEISDKYAKHYDDLLSAGNIDSNLSYSFLSNHYNNVDETRTHFNKNTPYKMFNLPLEDDKYGLFLYHKFPEEPVDEDRLPPDVADRLMKARESHNIIQNFDEKIKDPEYRKEIIDKRMQALSPHTFALEIGDPYLIARYLELAGAEKRLKKEKLQEAPFVTNTNQWTDLGLKRALVEAARGGYDKLIWTPGAEQADRYKLSQYIDELRHMSMDDGEYFSLEGYKNGRKIFDQGVPEDKLSSYVGKDIAGQIKNSTDNVYPKFGLIKGDNLAIGGQGMFEYYDRILPRRLLALAQEHDPEAKIEPHKEARDKTKNFPSLRITPRMRESITKRGFKAFARGGAVQKHLFNEEHESPSVKVPVMDHDKAVRRALMIARATGGKVSTFQQMADAPPADPSITPTANPKRLLFSAEGKGGVKGIVVPKHMWEGAEKTTGMRDINKARAEVYGAENRDPLTLGQISKIHKQTLEDHFAKPVAQQIADEKAALQRLRAAKHIAKDANTLDESEKLDTVRHERDDQGRTYVAYASKGIAGHALYTSGYGDNEKKMVLNTCPGQTTGCGGGISPDGVVDTSKGTCFAPNAESQYPGAAVRRACHAQAKHDPAMTQDWILAHTGSLRNAAKNADRSNQVVLFRPNVVDETDTTSRYVIQNLNKQRQEDGKPGIVANSYGKTNELHDPENGYFVTHSNVGPKTKLGSSIAENISRDNQRVRSTIDAADARGKDFTNDNGNLTPPKNSYMVTDVKRYSPLDQAMQQAITHAKYWSTGRDQNQLSDAELAEGPEGHFDGSGAPTTPDMAHYGHTTLNGRRYDYQKQHILHPRMVQVGNNDDGTPHMIPTDSRFKDNEFLPEDRFMTKNGKQAGAILMTTPTTSTSAILHQSPFTHHVDDSHVQYALQNNGEYQIDSPDQQEASRGKEYVQPQPVFFRAEGGRVDNIHVDRQSDDPHAFPEQNFVTQMHMAKRLGDDESHLHEVRKGKKPLPVDAANVEKALQVARKFSPVPGMMVTIEK